jgi:transposase InsO family protein
MDFIHQDIFTVYGIPNEILTDNRTNLVLEAMETFLQPTKVKHQTTTPYHPQTNGKIERFNGIIRAMLTKYLYGKPIRMWDEYLTQAIFAI